MLSEILMITIALLRLFAEGSRSFLLGYCCELSVRIEDSGFFTHFQRVWALTIVGFPVKFTPITANNTTKRWLCLHTI